MLRERDYYFYKYADWEIVMDKHDFPDCLGTRIMIKTYKTLDDNIENKRLLKDELDELISTSRDKLQRRECFVHGKYKEKIIKTLNYPMRPPPFEL